MERSDWIYGINPVDEALRSGQEIRAISVVGQANPRIREIVRTARSRGVRIEAGDRQFFDINFGKGHQGIAAQVARKKTASFDDLLDASLRGGRTPLFLVLDSIEDPRNFGALLRVADAAGVDGVIFQSHRSCPVTGTVAKASAGAIAHVSLAEVVNIKHAMRKMKEEGIVIIGADGDADTSLWDVPMNEPLALVIGSEGTGLRKTVRETCDILVKIPMQGRVSSLNASAAGAILMFECVRQRTSGTKAGTPPIARRRD